MTTPFQGPEQIFAILASLTAEQAITDSEVIKRASGELDGHPASLTLLMTPQGLGVVVIAVASGGTGFILTCGGDVSTPQLGTASSLACHSVTDSFHVK